MKIIELVWGPDRYLTLKEYTIEYRWKGRTRTADSILSAVDPEPELSNSFEPQPGLPITFDSITSWSF